MQIAKEQANVCFEPPKGGDAKSLVYDGFGNEIDSETAMSHSAISWEIVEEAIQYSSADHGASIPPEKSLRDYFEAALAVRKYEPWRRDLILEMADMWSNIVGEPIHKQRYVFSEQIFHVVEGSWSWKTLFEEDYP